MSGYGVGGISGTEWPSTWTTLSTCPPTRGSGHPHVIPVLLQVLRGSRAIPWERCGGGDYVLTRILHPGAAQDIPEGGVRRHDRPGG